MIKRETLTITCSGSAGAATGNSKTNAAVSGRLVAVHLDYTGCPATTDVTIATANAPVNTLLTISNANTDGWFYPRAQMQGADGAALTGIYEAAAIDDAIKVSVAQSDNAGTVVATLLVEVW